MESILFSICARPGRCIAKVEQCGTYFQFPEKNKR